MVTKPRSSKKLDSYSAKLGETILSWNTAEGALRSLLSTVCGASNATRILTAELGSRGLTDGLNAIAVTLPIEQRRAVEHVVAVYDRLREYRNYYVHGITAMGQIGDDIVGMTFMQSAKGKLGYATDFVEAATLVDIEERARALAAAISDTEDAIYPRPGSFADPPLPSPETLPLPDRLKKTLLYPLNEPRPPQP